MQRHRFGIALGAVALALVAATGLLVAGADGDHRHTFRHVEMPEGLADLFGGDDQTRAWIGVTIDEAVDLDDGGALITGIVEDSPAAGADLREGDVVVGIDGRTVRGPGALRERVGARDPGETVELEILRDGARRTVQLELGERAGHHGFRFEWSGEDAEQLREQMEQMREQLGEMDLDLDFSDRGPFGSGSFWHARRPPRLGVELTELSDELREHFGSTRGSGILVARLMPGMPAEAAGIEVGDVIESVDGETIADAGDLIRALDGREGETLRIGIVRERRTITIEVRLPEPEPAMPRPSGPRA